MKVGGGGVKVVGGGEDVGREERMELDEGRGGRKRREGGRGGVSLCTAARFTCCPVLSSDW